MVKRRHITIENVAVLMPFHKTKMNFYEQISFVNNTKRLNNYPIYLLLPENTNATPFLSIVPDINVLYFPRKYFDTYQGANLLWLEPLIYEQFKNYTFVLKCELDAFIFRDELIDWCNKDYNYVGAPWLNNQSVKNSYQFATFSKNIVIRNIKKLLSYQNRDKEFFVGNGGLSLRKVSVFLRLSKLLPFLVPNIYKVELQEDVIWSIYATSYFPFFKAADYKTALHFSIETNPKHCFEIIGNTLPFGCHAWYKYDINFWKPFIEAEGYDLP